MTLKADAAKLLERLRYAHQARIGAVADRHHSLAHAAVVIAQDLVDEASPELLRAALGLAVQPDGGQPPIPVVLGPQDAAAATVGVDEVMDLVAVYATGCTDWGRAYERAQGGGLVPNLAECHRLERQIEAAHKQLRAAVEQLALAAFVAETGRRLL